MSDVATLHKSRTATVVGVAMTVAVFVLPAIPALVTTMFPPTDHLCGPTDNCTEAKQLLAYVVSGFVVLVGLVFVVVAWTSPPRIRTVLLTVGLLGSMTGSGILVLLKPWYIT